MFTAVYWRYHVRYEEEFEEEHEAVNFLRHGEDHGDLSTECIMRDGVLLYDKPTLFDMAADRDWEDMPPTIDGVVTRPPVELIEVSIVKDPPAPGWEIKRVK